MKSHKPYIYYLLVTLSLSCFMLAGSNVNSSNVSTPVQIPKERWDNIYYAIVANMMAHNINEYMSRSYRPDPLIFNFGRNPYLRKNEKYKLDLTPVKLPVKNNYFGNDYIYYRFSLHDGSMYYDSCGFSGDCWIPNRSPLLLIKDHPSVGFIAYDTTRNMILFIAGNGYVHDFPAAFIDKSLNNQDIITYTEMRYTHILPENISVDSMVYFPNTVQWDSVHIYTSFYSRYFRKRFAVTMCKDSTEFWYKDVLTELPH